jgi:uncharacterized membrane-anchored protein YhcB (DUF1043 family)
LSIRIKNAQKQQSDLESKKKTVDAAWKEVEGSYQNTPAFLKAYAKFETAIKVVLPEVVSG